MHQLDISLQLSEAAAEEGNHLESIRGTVRQLLKRDRNWLAYYRAEMDGRADRRSPRAADRLRSISSLERQAMTAARSRDWDRGAQLLQDMAASDDIDDLTRWYCLRGLHRLLTTSILRERTRSNGTRLHWIRWWSPAQSIPYRVAPREFEAKAKGCRSGSVLMLIQMERLRTWRRFGAGQRSRIRQRLWSLRLTTWVELLRGLPTPGKASWRGADNLWVFDTDAFVLEAKNENMSKLHKSDSGQMLTSVSWFRKQFPLRDMPVAVFVSNSTTADRIGDFSYECFVLNEKGVSTVLDRLGQLVRAIFAGQIVDAISFSGISLARSSCLPTCAH